MAYTVKISSQFKKDFRRCIKRGLNMKLITDAMDILEATGTLPIKYRVKGSVLTRLMELNIKLLFKYNYGIVRFLSY